MADERPLLTELCAYREVLCVLHVQRTWSVEEDQDTSGFALAVRPWIALESLAQIPIFRINVWKGAVGDSDAGPRSGG